MAMWAFKTLLVLFILYLLVVALVWSLQTRILFPAAAVGPAQALPPSAERFRLDTADGARLRGVHLPPAPGTDRTAPVLLGFGGNAWNADEMAIYLHDLYPRSDVVAFHYRGYAPSTGSPGAAALLADAPLVHDLVAARFPGRPIVAIGFSVGTGVAAGLAARRRLAGLILVTPFDSLTKVASDHYPWLPVTWLFRHPMPVSDWLGRVRVPVSLIAAGGDTLVPARRTERLRRALPDLVYDRTIEGAGHNDIYRHQAFRDAMAEALARIEGSSGPEGKRSSSPG
jgi:pimeloyl-ACP methyl ester carboxylesterase